MTAPWTEALARMHGRIARTAASVTDGFPHFADPVTGIWTTSPGGDWTGGFWNGMLWLAARYGEDPRSRTWASRWTARLAPRARSETVFRGFLFYYGAALGSLLCGDAASIDRAHRLRKMLGGAMRQAGVLAAAGLIALEEMPKRLGEDHTNARFLAAELAKIPGIQVDPARVQTNIVVFDVSATGYTAEQFSEKLRAQGVLMNEAATQREVRAVTHFDVNREDCAKAAAIVKEFLVGRTSPSAPDLQVRHAGTVHTKLR